MPGPKDNDTRSIADKYAVDYYHRPLATRAWKTRWNYAVLVLALLVAGGSYIFRRSEAFQAGPVSASHASFGQRCEVCHDQPGQTAWRMLTRTTDMHSVTNDACSRCHKAVEHEQGLVSAGTCVSCHQEHRPERELTRVTDNDCTRCHEHLDLNETTKVSFAQEIGQFDEGAAAHPEFAVLRTTEDEVGPRHLAREVAAFIPGHDGGGKWIDRGGLKFNHHVHLDPAGVMHPDGKRIVLACAECHVPDDNGRTMRPIQYEQHCMKCHPLRLAGRFSRLEALPHSSVEEVRGVVRDRLSRLMEQALSDRAAATSTDSTDAARDRSRRLPMLPAPARLSHDQEQKLDTLVADADHAVFGLEAKGMCRKCHILEAHGDEWQVLMTNPLLQGGAAVAADRPPAMVPTRWMQHAAFSHKSHGAVACVDCHDAEKSSETSDILLPSIATCRKCHGASTATASTRVRSDCVLCHTYHAGGENLPGTPLDHLLSPGRAASVLPITR